MDQMSTRGGGGGSLFCNYKGFDSVVLLALVDGDYKFLWVEMGQPGQLQMFRCFEAHRFEAQNRGQQHRFP